MPSMAARQHDDLSRWPGTATGKSVPSSRQKGRTPPDDSAYGRCTPIAYTNRNPQARRKRVGLPRDSFCTIAAKARSPTPPANGPRKRIATIPLARASACKQWRSGAKPSATHACLTEAHGHRARYPRQTQRFGIRFSRLSGQNVYPKSPRLA